MNANIIQQPGPTWILQVEIPAFTQQELGAYVQQGLREATREMAQENLSAALKEVLSVKLATAARMLDIRTVETVRGYGRLAEKHPRYLPILWGETALSDKVMLSDLRAWCERNKRKDAKEKITQYEAKHA